MALTVKDLTREQLTELKLFFLSELVNEDNFAEFFETDHYEPSYMDIANIDELISDDFVNTYFEGITFCEADFFWDFREGGC